MTMPYEEADCVMHLDEIRRLKATIASLTYDRDRHRMAHEMYAKLVQGEGNRERAYRKALREAEDAVTRAGHISDPSLYREKIVEAQTAIRRGLDFDHNDEGES